MATAAAEIIAARQLLMSVHCQQVAGKLQHGAHQNELLVCVHSSRVSSHCSAGLCPDRALQGQAADLQVDRLSSSWATSLQMQAIRRVLQLPPSESRSTCVNLLER